MSAFTFVLAALAVFRLAYLIAIDDGPADACLRLRTAVANRYGLDSWQARGISCPVCTGFWLGWIAAALLQPPTWGEFGLWGLALSAPTVIVTRWLL